MATNTLTVTSTTWTLTLAAGTVLGSVRYDTAQALSSAQKEQAYANLGLAAYDDLSAANIALAIGVPYYDRALGRLNISTA